MKHLLYEHADMRLALFQLEHLLMNQQDWTDEVRHLKDVMTDHIRDEEDNEFPKLRASLDEQKSREMMAHIRREEAMIL